MKTKYLKYIYLSNNVKNSKWCALYAHSFKILYYYIVQLNPLKVINFIEFTL